MLRRSLRKKQTNNKSSQDRYKIPSCRNNSFWEKQIICLRPADYMRRNSLLIKVHVLNRLFTKNCITQTEIFLVSFLMYVFFIFPLDCCFWSLTTIFSTKMRWRKYPQEHQHPSPILSQFRHSSPPIYKNHKNSEVYKKFQAYARHLHWPRTLYFPCADAQNSQYLVY